MTDNRFVPARAVPPPNQMPTFDQGKVASSAQTVRDTKNNRTLMWQWVGEGDCSNNQVNCSGHQPHKLRSWEGVQTVPRVVWPSAACVANASSEDCALLVRNAPEIDKLVAWRQNVTVQSAGTEVSLSVAAARGPNNLKVHARFPEGFTGSKDLTLKMAGWAGGPAVFISLTGGTLQIGPAWRVDLRHKPTPQITENLTCTFSPTALAEHSVVEVFLDASVLEVFSDSGRCAFITRVYQHDGGENSSVASRVVMLKAAAGVELGVYGMGAAYSDYQPPGSKTDDEAQMRLKLARGWKTDDAKLLAAWDFPVRDGTVDLHQSSGCLQLGSSTGFFANLSASTDGAGVVTTGTSWPQMDSAIGMILQLAAPVDFSPVTNGFVASTSVDRPPTVGSGLHAYVQDGPAQNFAGDYHYFVQSPSTQLTTFVYTLNKTAAGLSPGLVTSFRIKVSGLASSVTQCGAGKSGVDCPVLNVKSITMKTEDSAAVIIDPTKTTGRSMSLGGNLWLSASLPQPIPALGMRMLRLWDVGHKQSPPQLHFQGCF